MGIMQGATVQIPGMIIIPDTQFPAGIIDSKTASGSSVTPEAVFI